MGRVTGAAANAGNGRGIEGDPRSVGVDEERPLDYARQLGLDVSDLWSLVDKVEAGFPYDAFRRFMEQSLIPMFQLGDMVGMAVRTLSRREDQGWLTPDESEKLLRVARVFASAVGLFEGDREEARRWLSTPKRALGGRVPLETIRTEIGAREVEDLIMRIEHGVFT
jgi:putative toxin-antitoxin system antitoxin component (TIGR02293 family)